MLNHSCTRCRSKKLRCDGSSPCSNCRAKGMSHVCQRAQRKERPRKSVASRQPPSQPDASNGIASFRTLSTSSASSAQDGKPVSSSSLFDDGVAAADGMAKLHVRTDTERSNSGSESGRSPLSTSSSSSTTAGASKSTPPQFFPAEPHFRGCLVTPQIISDARQYIGSLHAALRLINYVFQWRCQSMAHSCVHIPSIKHTLRQLFSDEWAQEIPQDRLALALMAVAMSVQFCPRRGPYAHVFAVAQAMGPHFDPAERQQLIHRLARSIVQSRMLDTNTSLESIQTIVLLLIYDLDDEGFKDRVWMNAVRCAQALELNHIQHDHSGAVPSLQAELGVRVWWFLVCRDWLNALATGTYKLHPNDFTTRLPLIITDEDLMSGNKTVNRQAGEVSPVSVSIPFIGLASLIRQLVDIKNDRSPEDFSQEVADAFDYFVEGLPYIFSLSTTHIASLDDNLFTQQRLESERWLLHQQIFHAYMHFDELRLDRPICPQMVALANHTLQLQDRVRARCHIIDLMRINVTGVLRAITVLTIDLLQKHRDSKVSLARQVTLGKIKEAIYKCEISPNLAEGDLDNVYKLIEMEETAWAAKSRAAVPRRISAFHASQGVPMQQQQQQQQQQVQHHSSQYSSVDANAHPPSASRPGSDHAGQAPPQQLQGLSLSPQISLAGSGPGSHHSGIDSNGVGGSLSGTASEGSVGTTSPVVDMPTVPMDLPSSSLSGTGVGTGMLAAACDPATQQQAAQGVPPSHRESLPSVLMTSEQHALQVEQQQQQQRQSQTHTHAQAQKQPMCHNGAAPQQQHVASHGMPFPAQPQASFGEMQMPVQPAQQSQQSQHPQQSQQQQYHQQLPNGVVPVGPGAPMQGTGLQAQAPFTGSGAPPPDVPGVPSFSPAPQSAVPQQQQQQQQREGVNGAPRALHYSPNGTGTGQYLPLHQQQQQHDGGGGRGGHYTHHHHAHQPQQPHVHHQQQQHHHHSAHLQPHGHAQGGHAPQQNATAQHHLDVAQWASLVPSDQAVSPIFAPDLLAAHQPSLEELYAAFVS